jgi:hypothetical protein
VTGRIAGYLRRHHWGILATFIALSGTAYAVGGSGGNIHACVDTSTGTVRIARHCRQSERAMTWAKTGPQGSAGPSDGYSATGDRLATVAVPPGDYLATGGCTARLDRSSGQSSTILVLGEAEGQLGIGLPPGPTGVPNVNAASTAVASVPNLGEDNPAGPQGGNASLSNAAGFAYRKAERSPSLATNSLADPVTSWEAPCRSRRSVRS